MREITIWEKFLFRYSFISCPLFFFIGLGSTITAYYLVLWGNLEFDQAGTWDVRGNKIIDLKDAYSQSEFQARKKFENRVLYKNPALMMSLESEPTSPKFNALSESEKRRTESLDDIIITFEAMDKDGETQNVFSQDIIKYVKEFEDFMLDSEVFLNSCRQVYPVDNQKDPRCRTPISTLAYLFIDQEEHKRLINDTFSPFGLQACDPDMALTLVVSGQPRCLPCESPSGQLFYGQDIFCFSTSYSHSVTQNYTFGGIKRMCNLIQDSTTVADVILDMVLQNTTKASEAQSYLDKVIAQVKLFMDQTISSDFQCHPHNHVIPSAKYLRAAVQVGYPVSSYGSLKLAQARDIKAFEASHSEYDGFYQTLLRKKLEIEAKTEDLRIYMFSETLAETLFLGIIFSDAYFAVGSLTFVLLWLIFATRSVFLSVVGMFEILFSLPTALLFWYAICQQRYFGFLTVMMISIIIGIGADDIFVLLDAYVQSSYERDLDTKEKRFVWAYRRASKGMLVTTVTTLFGFFAVGFSTIPSISSFGFIASLVIIFDYLYVISLLASAIGVKERICNWNLCLNPFRGLKKENKTNIQKYWPILLIEFILLILAITLFAARIPLFGTCLVCSMAVVLVMYMNLDEPGEKRKGELAFENTVFNFFKKTKYIFVLLWGSILISAAVTLSMKIKTAEEEVRFLDENNDLMRFIDSLSHFSDDTLAISVTYVFGFQEETPIDRTTVSKYVPGVSGSGPQTRYSGNYLGEVQFDNKLHEDLKDLEVQKELLDFCRAHGDERNLVDGEPLVLQKLAPCEEEIVNFTRIPKNQCQRGVYCFFEQVRDFLNSSACFDKQTTDFACEFPNEQIHEVILSNEFKEFQQTRLQVYLSKGLGHLIPRLNTSSGAAYENSTLKFFWISVNSTIPFQPMPYSEKQGYFKKYDSMIFKYLQDGKTQKLKPGHVSRFWSWMVTEETLFVSSLYSVLISAGIVFLVLVLATRNLHMAILGFASLGMVFFTVGLIMIILGWELSIIESICVITVVGLSVDYSIHMMHAYNHAPALAKTRDTRVRHALSTMGVSIFSGLATTCGSALFLVFCQVTFFKKFGMFLGMTVIISFLVATSFLMPLCLLIGPENDSGNISKFFRRRKKSEASEECITKANTPGECIALA